jgi:hypothetical protein
MNTPSTCSHLSISSNECEIVESTLPRTSSTVSFVRLLPMSQLPSFMWDPLDQLQVDCSSHPLDLACSVQDLSTVRDVCSYTPPPPSFTVLHSTLKPDEKITEKELCDLVSHDKMVN